MVSPNTLLITERKMPKYEGEIQLAGSLRAARRRAYRETQRKIKVLMKAGVDLETLLNGPDISEQYAALPAPTKGVGRRREIRAFLRRNKRK